MNDGAQVHEVLKIDPFSDDNLEDPIFPEMLNIFEAEIKLVRYPLNTTNRVHTALHVLNQARIHRVEITQDATDPLYTMKKATQDALINDIDCALSYLNGNKSAITENPFQFAYNTRTNFWDFAFVFPREIDALLQNRLGITAQEAYDRIDNGIDN